MSVFLVFDSIERYAPGFKESVVGRDVLTPPDLEGIFGLTGGVSVELVPISVSHLVFGTKVRS